MKRFFQIKKGGSFTFFKDIKYFIKHFRFQRKGLSDVTRGWKLQRGILSRCNNVSYILVLMLISHNLHRNAQGTRITLVYKVQFLCSQPSFLMDTRTWQRLLTYCKHHKKYYTSMYDQHFYGGRRGGGWGVGSSESCKGGKRRKLFRGGFEGVTTPAPLKNLNHTITVIIPSRCNSHQWQEIEP